MAETLSRDTAQPSSHEASHGPWVPTWQTDQRYNVGDCCEFGTRSINAFKRTSLSLTGSLRLSQHSGQELVRRAQGFPKPNAGGLIRPMEWATESTTIGSFMNASSPTSRSRTGCPIDIQRFGSSSGRCFPRSVTYTLTEPD